MKSTTANLWAVIKKLQTWISSGKVIKGKAVERVVELKEDRSLFARLMVCKSRQDVDIKDAISLYEFLSLTLYFKRIVFGVTGVPWKVIQINTNLVISAAS